MGDISGLPGTLWKLRMDFVLQVKALEGWQRRPTIGDENAAGERAVMAVRESGSADAAHYYGTEQVWNDRDQAVCVLLHSRADFERSDDWKACQTFFMGSADWLSSACSWLYALNDCASYQVCTAGKDVIAELDASATATRCVPSKQAIAMRSVSLRAPHKVLQPRQNSRSARKGSHHCLGNVPKLMLWAPVQAAGHCMCL